MTDKIVSPLGEKNQPVEIWRHKINIFLIKYFNLLTVALSAAIFAVGLAFLIYPGYQRVVGEGEAARKSLEAEYNNKLAYLNSLISVNKAYKTVTDSAKQKISLLVPPAGDSTSLIPLMETIALSNGAALNSVKVEPEAGKTQFRSRSSAAEQRPAGSEIFRQPPPGVGAVKIELSLFMVNYAVLKNIIKTLENNLPLMDVAKIDYQVNEGRALLTVYSYYLNN